MFKRSDFVKEKNLSPLQSWFILFLSPRIQGASKNTTFLFHTYTYVNKHKLINSYSFTSQMNYYIIIPSNICSYILITILQLYLVARVRELGFQKSKKLTLKPTKNDVRVGVLSSKVSKMRSNIFFIPLFSLILHF